MKFIVEDEKGYHLGPYLNYLDSIKDKLPTNARNFAFYPGRYDISNKQCLHDSWIEKIDIDELASGDHHTIRRVQIKITLLGAFHDGYHFITYKDVEAYQIKADALKRKITLIGHGDWLVDEVTLDENGFITHEIEFSDSGKCTIVCADISYKWQPK